MLDGGTESGEWSNKRKRAEREGSHVLQGRQRRVHSHRTREAGGSRVADPVVAKAGRFSRTHHKAPREREKLVGVEERKNVVENEKGAEQEGSYLLQGRQRCVRSNGIREAGGSRVVDLVEATAGRIPRTYHTSEADGRSRDG